MPRDSIGMLALRGVVAAAGVAMVASGLYGVIGIGWPDHLQFVVTGCAVAIAGVAALRVGVTGHSETMDAIRQAGDRQRAYLAAYHAGETPPRHRSEVERIRDAIYSDDATARDARENDPGGTG